MSEDYNWLDGLSFLDQPSDYTFTLGGTNSDGSYSGLDLSGLNFLLGDQSAGLDSTYLNNLMQNIGSFSNPNNEPLFFDTQTGQLVTQSQMQQIQLQGPTGAGTVQGSANPDPLNVNGSAGMGTSTTPSWLQNLQNNFSNNALGSTIQALGALGGLGMAGAGIYGAIAGNGGGQTTTQNTTTTKAPMTPQQTALLGAQPSTASPTGTGLTSLANQAIGNLGGQNGLLNQQQAQLQALQSQIPQLNPAITQALGQQALGMAQGQLPALNDPIAQQRIADVFAPGFAQLDYNQNNALDQARLALSQRGFLGGGNINEGPTQALTAPILAANQLGRTQLMGQQSQAQLNLAQQLPLQAAQLAQNSLNMQNVPFQSGLNLANSYTNPINTQAQIPLDLMRILEQGRSTSSSTGTTSPDLTFLQRLAQAAPALQSAGSIFGALGQQGGLFGSPAQTNSLSGLASGGLYTSTGQRVL